MDWKSLAVRLIEGMRKIAVMENVFYHAISPRGTIIYSPNRQLLERIIAALVG